MYTPELWRTATGRFPLSMGGCEPRRTASNPSPRSSNPPVVDLTPCYNMCLHTKDSPGLDGVVNARSLMSTRELDWLQAAMDQRRADVKQTVVAERRAYGGGLLQREHHRNPETGYVGPGYWYF